MERLTKRNKHGGIESNIFGCHIEVERQKLLNALAAYEEMEAEGRMGMFPVPVGTEIFYITNSHRAATNNKNHLARVIKSRKVDSITIGKDGYMSMSYGTTLRSSVSEIGKTVFFTRKEAEDALAAIKMEGAKE